MKSYIGTKVVKAEPMIKEIFDVLNKDCDREAGDTEGYLVKYEDGYTSWSPKEVFERCYREITSAERALIPV